ncbi:Cysteine-rich RLK (receptor-like protein kinase) 8 [Cucumis melo var. makuwa]|uniref:Cysteine-rich RLK (Receptor-like protein kinase) 8 n=1 Tax=Cucumis melo var. makuwa TaxID=1194695 RepID=A0A5D3BG71_CUCMM|nr:Cysteine-rich RLK (receptor-like protein kinase) 8 [Cucumis melo var. makuwa]
MAINVLKENLSVAQNQMKKMVDLKRRELKFKVGEEDYLKLRPYRQHSLARKRSEKLAPKLGKQQQVQHRPPIITEEFKLQLWSETVMGIRWARRLECILQWRFRRGSLYEPPPGFEAQFEHWVCKLQKSLYGLKQSSRAEFDRLTTFIKSQGYSQRHSDPTLFTKVSKAGKIATLIVYVDDIVLSGDDTVGLPN